MPVYQDKTTGKYYFTCYYVDWQGERRRKVKRGFTLARDAKKAEREFLDQYAEQCNMSFSAFYDIYIADCKARLKADTVETKQSKFKGSILPYFSNFCIADITPAHVRQWQNKIMQEYKPTTQRQLQAQLSSLFNFAVKFYGLKRNPAKIAGSIGTLKAGRLDFWTLEEFNKVIACEEDISFKTAFILLFYSGLRSGELLALNVGDYDAKEKTVTVNKTLARVKGGFAITTPKTEKANRIIKLPLVATKQLDKYIAALYEPKGSDRLFISQNKLNLVNTLKKDADKAGVKRIRVHDLRHSHASLLINNNVNIKAVSDRLGHEDIQTTLNIYAHLYEHQQSNIAALLDKLQS
jgi:integrase